MSQAAVLGVLALQGDVREHLQALGELGVSARAVRRPAELAAVDGLVLPGGESTTIIRLAQLFGMVDPLRAYLARGRPVFGSCAGMILLADRVIDGETDQLTLGGLDITVRRNAFGRQVDSFEVDLDFAGIGDVHAVFIRAPWVEQFGPAVEPLARTAGKVVAVRQGALLATAFHPELTGDLRVHKMFVDMVKECAR